MQLPQPENAQHQIVPNQLADVFTELLPSGAGGEAQGRAGDDDAAAAAGRLRAGGAGAAGGHAARGAGAAAGRLLPQRPHPLLRAAVRPQAAAALWPQVQLPLGADRGWACAAWRQGPWRAPSASNTMSTWRRQLHALATHFAGSLRRASQLRGVVAELRKVCAYPTLLMEFSMGEPSGSGNGGDADSPTASPRASSVPAVPAAPAGDGDRAPVDLVTASGKLRVLQQLLPALQASGHRVLLLSQSRKVRD
jgi:hypothetical protein